MKSRGACEVCKEPAVCNDVPSSALPPTKDRRANVTEDQRSGRDRRYEVEDALDTMETYYPDGAASASKLRRWAHEIRNATRRKGRHE